MSVIVCEMLDHNGAQQHPLVNHIYLLQSQHTKKKVYFSNISVMVDYKRCSLYIESRMSEIYCLFPKRMFTVYL